MKKSTHFFTQMRAYASLYEDAVKAGLNHAAKTYQILSNECRKEALQALEAESKEEV